jgi:excisionase family DNA binding protein
MTTPPTSNGKTISAIEAAELLGLSKPTICRLIQGGQIAAYKLTGRKTSPYRVYLDSVIAYAKRVQGRDISTNQ